MPSRVLVVCCSRGGTTLRVAKHVAEALGGELELIEEVGSRTGFGGYVRSALEAVAKGLPTIRTQRDPRDYDLVVLGAPTWAGTMASPLRSYLFMHRGALRNVGLFTIMGGRGGEQVVEEMQLACGVSEATTCVLTQREVDRDAYRAKCDRFVAALKDAWQQRASFPARPLVEAGPNGGAAAPRDLTLGSRRRRRTLRWARPA